MPSEVVKRRISATVGPKKAGLIEDEAEIRLPMLKQ
jgi:hypothetical protein